MTYPTPVLGLADRAPIAVALDAPDLATATAWAAQAGPFVAAIKIGLETYLRDGADGVRAVYSALDADPHEPPALFLDLKLHDIPNTVAGAARSVAQLRPALLTVHALGGPAMIEAAVAALPDTRITAVTILTSMDAEALAAVGIADDPRTAVLRLARMAVAAGARALVCSPLEVADVRAAVPDDVVLVTPGVRPAGADVGDQRRVATPEQALADGADMLVIGRPITGAADIAAACRGLAGSLSGNR
ncbi:MAG: orotidine-5-phosphate decarboxylase [Actinomycetota bacterium]|nr:orotidine-5-phosphate decarboxylase [Actinomycetota bacterium]